jgi:hypothetical protein
MTNRFLTVAAVCLAGASIFASAALATGEPPPPIPPPPTLPPGPGPVPDSPPPTTPALTIPKKCKDDMRPSSTLKVQRGKKNPKRLVRGTARDLGCAVSGKGTVRRVQVSLKRKTGRRCQSVSMTGRLGRPGSCTRAVWLKAAGTAKWSFRLPKSLRRGTYLISSRAVDAAGNVGRPRSARFVIR